jgi:hypothetical protein
MKLAEKFWRFSRSFSGTLRTADQGWNLSSRP